jgi:hypothetical protein
MDSLTTQLMVPITALYEAQKSMDDRTLQELQLYAPETCEVNVNSHTIEIPRLLVTGVRNTYIASARMTMDFEPTPIRLLSKSSSVTMCLQVDPVPNLGEILAETTTVSKTTTEEDVL